MSLLNLFLSFLGDLGPVLFQSLVVASAGLDSGLVGALDEHEQVRLLGVGGLADLHFIYIRLHFVSEDVVHQLQ